MRHFRSDLDAMRHTSAEELTEIDGIGEVLADAWVKFWADAENNRKVDNLLKKLTIEKDTEESQDNTLEGEVIVITGSLQHFTNRKALQELIESRGGKVTGSVTSKTTCLINNDTTSNSSKNKKAKELGIPILSEEDFMKKLEAEGENHAD